jgi:archaemetzincin
VLRLDLVPIYTGHCAHLLQRLSESLERDLKVTIQQRPPWFNPERAFDAARGQYSSTALLRLLLDDSSTDGSPILAVTTVDLCTPILTYVFGEAQLGGRAAVVSLHRLRAEMYGLPRDDDLLFERLRKESVHELGHTFGLIHCDRQQCVMHASTYAEEIDLKTAAFCRDCWHAVEQSSRIDNLRRKALTD